MRLVVKAVAIFILFTTSLWANDLIPDRRLAITRDVDFYGSDLQSLFDTTLPACERACLADDRCQAFTFNARSNSCFPKSDVSEVQPYDGAISARVLLTDPKVLAAASERAAELNFMRPDDFQAAKDFAGDLARLYDTMGEDAISLWRLGRNSQSSSAQRYFGAAITLSDMPGLWVEYSRASIHNRSGDYSDKRRNKARAL